MDEFKDVQLIAVHVHGPGLFHSLSRSTRLEDMKGLKVRGGSRIINIMLEQLGATPVGMPVPQVGEALSKGVISATTIPWEVVPALKVEQIAKNSTGFSGDKGLYTQTFAVAMNKALRQAAGRPEEGHRCQFGMAAAAMFGRAMDDGDKVGLASRRRPASKISRSARRDRTLAARRQGTRAVWFKEVAGKGIDGPEAGPGGRGTDREVQQVGRARGLHPASPRPRGARAAVATGVR